VCANAHRRGISWRLMPKVDQIPTSGFYFSNGQNGSALLSSSKTFFRLRFYRFLYVKKLQTQTINTENPQGIPLYEKAACKMLLKLTSVVNFKNILQTWFLPISLCQKDKPYEQKRCAKALILKKLLVK